jgi:signal transduction histidine kinase
MQSNSITRDLTVTILFGVLSATLGMIQLNTPGFEGSYSDLREIGLLLCLFHIVNPLFIIPLCLISLLGLPFEIRLLPIFIMHVIPLLVTWYLYKWIEKIQMSNIRMGLAWSLLAIAYYTLFLYPILIVSYKWVGINEHSNFMESYSSLFFSGTFEVVTTTLISSLYLIQLSIRRSLELTNKNLEELVKQRTHELSETNFELQSLNENLEQLVKDRTKKIDTQLDQIVKYAHMNAHEVRAPVARILGLMNLLKNETLDHERKDLVEKLDVVSIELDTIVRKMNQVLEKEVGSVDLKN